MQQESRLLRSARICIFITVILKIGMMCDMYEYEATKKGRSNTLGLNSICLFQMGIPEDNPQNGLKIKGRNYTKSEELR
jgi:hypothetical protein